MNLRTGYASRLELPLICIKQAHMVLGSHNAMTGLPGIFLLLLLSPLALADNNSNAVNERIPVNAADMEAHWQVDCTSVRESLLLAATQASNQPDCGIPTKLRQDTRLCAFIYQAPGTKTQHKCPDYSRISEHLQQAIKLTQCARLFSDIREKLACKIKAP
jgi:hypothetical protein